MSDENPAEALAAAEESIPLFEAGAGPEAYSSTAEVVALLCSTTGDNVRVAHVLHRAITHEHRNGSRALFAEDVKIAVVVLAGCPNRQGPAAVLTGVLTGPALYRLGDTSLAANETSTSTPSPRPSLPWAVTNMPGPSAKVPR